MATEIRRLTMDDFDEIMRVWSDAGLPIKPHGRESREQFAVEIDSPQCAVFGLFEEGCMLAVGIANWDGRRGWINRVAVDPDRRGEGLAGIMVRKCEDFLHASGAHVICALIEDINYPSISCFQKEGFRGLENIRYFVKYDSPES